MSRIKGITIELGGDTSKLDKSIKDVTKSTKALDKELRGINYGLKLDPKNTELLATKHEVLTERVAASAEKVALLKERHEEAAEQFAKGEISDEEFRAITRELGIAEGELQKFEKELESVSKQLKDVGKSWTETGEKIQGVGKDLTKKVTAPIVAVGTAAMVAWNEVDDALDGIVMATGATGDELDSLEQSFHKLFTSLPVSAEEVGKAIGEVNTQFGLQGEALEEVSELAIKYAKITGQDVSDAVIGVKKVMETYGLEVEDAGYVMDIFTKASQDTGVEVTQLQETVRAAAPQIKALGLEFGEAVFFIAKMEQAGIDSSKVMSAMSLAAGRAAQKGMTLKEAMDELEEELAGTNDESERLNLVAALFGTRNAPLMLDAIERGILDFGEFAESVDEAGGSVERTFLGILDPSDRMITAMNNLKKIGYDVGQTLQETLEPVMESLVEKLQSATEWFQSLSPETREFMVKAILLAAALGPVIFVLGSIIKAGGAILTGISTLGPALVALASGPVGWVILALAALVAAGVYVYKNWDEIKEKVKILGENLRQRFDEIKTNISNAWENVKQKTSDTWDNVKESASEKWEGIKENVKEIVGDIVEWTSTKWDQLKKKTADTWDYIKEKTSTAWGRVKESVGESVEGTKTASANAWESVKKNTSEGWNAIKQNASTTWGKIKEAVTGPMTDASGAVEDSVAAAELSLSRELTYPKINKVTVPQLRIVGGFSLKPLSVPSIQWYDKGGIFTSPSIIGVGEKRPEFVGALDDLRYLIGDELDKRSGRSEGDISVNVGEVHIHDDRDVDELMREIAWRLRREMSLET